tara:strand:- start:3344 stop:3691 length:348 start_codon:yes stop_codon:yes gene_type:complete
VGFDNRIDHRLDRSLVAHVGVDEPDVTAGVGQLLREGASIENVADDDPRTLCGEGACIGRPNSLRCTRYEGNFPSHSAHEELLLTLTHVTGTSGAHEIEGQPARKWRLTIWTGSS